MIMLVIAMVELAAQNAPNATALSFKRTRQKWTRLVTTGATRLRGACVCAYVLSMTPASDVGTSCWRRPRQMSTRLVGDARVRCRHVPIDTYASDIDTSFGDARVRCRHVLPMTNESDVDTYFSDACVRCRHVMLATHARDIYTSFWRRTH